MPLSAEETREVIEAPDLDDPEALIFDSMTIVQALEVGLRAERPRGNSTGGKLCTFPIGTCRRCTENWRSSKRLTCAC